MFCSNCGYKAGDGEKFCTSCGSALEIEEVVNETPVEVVAPNQTQAQTEPNYQQNNAYANQTSTYQVNPYTNQYASAPAYPMQQYQPMKWFKFLIYFYLFLGAFGGLIGGISMLSYGNLLEELAGDMIRSMHISIFEARNFIDDLSGYCSFYGIANLALAVLAIVTRFRLAGYKRNAPLFANLYFIISSIVPIIFSYGFVTTILEYAPANEHAVVSAIKTGLTVGLSIPTAISAVICIANYAYFKKRKSMFNY